MKILFILFILFFVGCASAPNIIKQEWEGLVYTTCSESPDVLNKNIQQMKKQGFVETGSMIFRQVEWNGSIYNCFCKSLYLFK